MCPNRRTLVNFSLTPFDSKPSFSGQDLGVDPLVSSRTASNELRMRTALPVTFQKFSFLLTSAMITW